MAKIKLDGFGRYIAESGAKVNWGPPYYPLPKYRKLQQRIPDVGEVIDGWCFLGGEPSNKSRWEWTG